MSIIISLFSLFTVFWLWCDSYSSDVRLQHAGDFNAVNYCRPLMAASSPLVLWWWLESEWWPGWWPGWLTGGYCSVLPQLICPLTASCLNCGGFGWWSSEPWAESRERTEQRALESRTVTWRVTLSRYWRDVTRNWLQAVLPGPGASQLGPDCYVTTLARGNTGHRGTQGHRGRRFSDQLYARVET